MKKFLFMAIVIIPVLVCILGFKDVGTPTNNEVLLNPSISSLLEVSLYNDVNVRSVWDSFTEKSFMELSRYCWSDSKTQKCMVLFYKAGKDFHASEADIGGFLAEYKSEAKKWVVQAKSLAFAENGSWGKAPEPHFIKLGPDRYGFMMESNYMSQGYESKSLTVYGAVANNFIEMLRIPSYSNNIGTDVKASNLYEVKVNLYQLIDNKKDFYDMKAQIIINGKYAMTPDDEFYKLFGKSGEIGFVFKDGIYAIKGKKQSK
jgi:hypothetical protein